MFEAVYTIDGEEIRFKRDSFESAMKYLFYGWDAGNLYPKNITYNGKDIFKDEDHFFINLLLVDKFTDEQLREHFKRTEFKEYLNVR